MVNKIVLYIAISIVVSLGTGLGIGYCTGHYVASSKAEKDVAAIRAILEKQEAEKAANQEKFEEYLKESEAMTERQEKSPSKSY